MALGFAGGGGGERAAGAAGQTYRIGGRVTNQQGQGIPATTMTLTGSQASVRYTDSGGYYTFFNLPGGGNYTVTPTKNYHTFSPSWRSYNNLSGNQTNANFTGIKNSYSISGRILDTQGQPVGQATVSVSGTQTVSVNM